jgi:predicted phosphoribosyltransferase
MRFADRAEAGQVLAELLLGLRDEDVVVLALPRGGVPVAAPVARALHAPLDVILVRKVGLPMQPELAMAAVGEGGVFVPNRYVLQSLAVDDGVVAAAAAEQLEVVRQRAQLLRAVRPAEPLAGRIALIVDDGLATGSTALAAVQVARAHGAERVIVAAPVAPPDGLAELRAECDDLVVAATPSPFDAIGRFYDDFTQVSDDEVVQVLAEFSTGGAENA